MRSGVGVWGFYVLDFRCCPTTSQGFHSHGRELNRHITISKHQFPAKLQTYLKVYTAPKQEESPNQTGSNDLWDSMSVWSGGNNLQSGPPMFGKRTSVIQAKDMSTSERDPVAWS